MLAVKGECKLRGVNTRRAGLATETLLSPGTLDEVGSEEEKYYVKSTGMKSPVLSIVDPSCLIAGQCFLFTDH